MTCPVCHKMLCVDIHEDHTVTVYCPHGACKDNQMNDGSEAATVQVAYEKLYEIAEQPNTKDK